jgi:hypothetical protein
LFVEYGKETNDMEDLSKVPVEELELQGPYKDDGRVLAVIDRGESAAPHPYVIIFERDGEVDYFYELTRERLNIFIRRKKKQVKLIRWIQVYTCPDSGYFTSIASRKPELSSNTVAQIRIDIDVEEGHGLCSEQSSSD